MLNEDIASGAGWLVDRTKRLIGGAIKGAIIFGALTLAGAAIFTAWPAITLAATAIGASLGLTSATTTASLLTATHAATAASAILPTIGGAITSLWSGLTGAALSTTAGSAATTLTAAGYGALGGAAFLGATSVLPSVKTLFHSSPAPELTGPLTADYGDKSLSQALSLSPDRAQNFGNFDNPYAQEGLGAKLAARGSQPALDTAQSRS